MKVRLDPLREYTQMSIEKHNVGRIAERIVSNELEFHGFRVSDLNKEGTSVNADLLAAKNGRTWQIQVKGASMKDGEGWWFNYGYCNEEIIDRVKPMFNGASSFYKAEVVVLVAVRSPSAYCCLILPIIDAEKAAQMNLDYSFRTPLAKGGKRKPGKVWTNLDYVMRSKDAGKVNCIREEQTFIKSFHNNWNIS
jgi:hypothetical protein